MPHTDAMPKPNPDEYNPDPKYMRKLVERSGLSQVKCAAAIGVSQRTMRSWVSGEKQFPYSAQFTMEQLAKGKK